MTGRLTETLGGVRVVKGYHAEGREEGVFAAGVGRLLDNVLKTLTATSLMGLSANVLLGIVGGTVMFVGTRQIYAGQIKLGDFVAFSAFMAFLIAPVAQIVSIGTQLTEAFAGLERTREVLSEIREEDDPQRKRALGRDQGRRPVRRCRVSSTSPVKPVLRNVTFDARARDPPPRLSGPPAPGSRPSSGLSRRSTNRPPAKSCWMGSTSPPSPWAPIGRSSA